MEIAITSSSSGWWSNLLNSQLIGVIIGGCITLVANHFQGRANRKLEKEKLEATTLKEKWEVFSRLKGLQAVITQDFLDLYISIIGAAYQGVFIKLQSSDGKDKEIQMLQQIIDRRSRYRSRLSGDRQKLYETIGSIIVLFHNRPGLYQNIQPFYSQLDIFEEKYKIRKVENALEIEMRNDEELATIENAERKKLEDNLKNWKYNQVREIEKLVQEEIYSPFDMLSNYLKDELNSEREINLPWHQIWGSSSSQTSRDKVLWELAMELAYLNGPLSKYELLRRTKLECTDLDIILDMLEQENRIKRTFISTSKSGIPKETISLKSFEDPKVTDGQLAAPVYELYGLTEAEIKIVEGVHDR